MARVEFTTFSEASDYCRELSAAIRSSVAVNRDGDIWWIEDPRSNCDGQRRNLKVTAEDSDASSGHTGSSKRNVKPEAARGNKLPFFGGDRKLQELIHTLAELPGHLNKQIIGQVNPIEEICRRLRIAYTGLSHRTGPVAVFLCIGPSGVGKTELAKALSAHLMDGEESLIRLDMSEYMEEHSISKLIGSPPGYVGYSEDGQLTGKLSEQPRSILLLDEVEKAHPRVMDIFLQLFGEGRITDSKGMTVDAKDALVIMTSNIRIEESARIGFGAEKQSTDGIQLAVLKKYFRTELVNRISEVVVFNSLERDSIRKILAPLLEEIRTNLIKLTGVELSVSSEVIEFLIDEGYDPDFGARELKRTVEQHIQGGLSELMVNGEIQAAKSVSVYMSDGKVVFALKRNSVDSILAEALLGVRPAGDPHQIKESADFFIGMKVRHTKFGEGIIRKIEGEGVTTENGKNRTLRI